MKIIEKPVLSPTWADHGDKYQPTADEIAQGWPQSIVPPSRQRFNWILNYLSELSHYLFQRGLPEWDGLATYPAGAKVSVGNHSFMARKETTGEDPTHVPEAWVRWGFTQDEIVDLIRTIAASGIPPGAINYFAGPRAPQGWLAAQGQLVKRADFPQLWEYAQNSSNIASDEVWHSSLLWGAFSTGDGNQTFRLPDLRGVFIRSFDGRSTAGGGVDPEDARLFGSKQEQDTQTLSVISPHEKWHLANLDAAMIKTAGANKGLLSAVDPAVPSEITTFTASLDTNYHPETHPVNVALLACIKI